jgi:ParB family chromosome partitioning protein
MARKALGRGLDALIPNARDLLTPSSPKLPSRDEEDEDEIGEKKKGERPEPAVDREGLVRLSQAPPIEPTAVADRVPERVPPGMVTVELPPVPQRDTPGPTVSAIPSAAGPAGPAVGVGSLSGHSPVSPVSPIGTASAFTSPSPSSLGELNARQGLASGRALPVIDIGVDRIKSNPYQPRMTFDEVETEELAASIRSKGILQPVLVRRKGPGYELIAGERRLRAARRAGMNSIPALVREAGDREMLELALIENEQRVELNPIESARSYERIINEFALSQTELADVLGRDRSTVANLLRLLRLPEKVQKLVQERALSMGHARALVAVDDARRCQTMAERAVRTGMPVRALERLVQGGTRKRPVRRPLVVEDPELAPFIQRLRHRFGTQVAIHRHNGRGKVEIEFYNQEDLERILEVLAVLHDA